MKARRVDCALSPQLCRRHRIYAYPTLQVFHGSKLFPPSYRGRILLNDIMYSAEETMRRLSARGSGARATGYGCQVSGNVMTHRVPGRVELALKNTNLVTFSAGRVNLTHQVHQFFFNSIPDSFTKVIPRSP